MSTNEAAERLRKTLEEIAEGTESDRIGRYEYLRDWVHKTASAALAPERSAGAAYQPATNEGQSSSVEALADLLSEHRCCGPKYDGCYSHWPMPHCRADGMAWPCDVDRIRARLSEGTDR